MDSQEVRRAPRAFPMVAWHTAAARIATREPKWVHDPNPNHGPYLQASVHITNV